MEEEEEEEEEDEDEDEDEEDSDDDDDWNPERVMAMIGKWAYSTLVPLSAPNSFRENDFRFSMTSS